MPAKPAKYDPEISGPGYIKVSDRMGFMKTYDAEKFGESILIAVREARFIEKNGMTQQEHDLRESLGDWNSPLKSIAEGRILILMEEGRWKASFSHGHTD